MGMGRSMGMGRGMGRGMYDTVECTACENDEESQKHILECNELIKRNKDIEENLVMKISSNEM